MKHRILPILLTLLTILWIGFIFSNSLENAEESGQKTDTVKEVVDQVAEELGHPEGVDYTVIRKSGHVVEFMVLGMLMSCSALAWRMFSSKFLTLKNTYTLCGVLALCALIAVADELIQKLSEGRVSAFLDVLIDIGGTFAGLVLFSLVYFGFCAIRAHRERKAERAV